jgi:hypothetical protein
MDGVEDGERGECELGDLQEDLETLTLGRASAGAVRAEGNVVGYLISKRPRSAKT